MDDQLKLLRHIKRTKRRFKTTAVYTMELDRAETAATSARLALRCFLASEAFLAYVEMRRCHFDPLLQLVFLKTPDERTHTISFKSTDSILLLWQQLLVRPIAG